MTPDVPFNFNRFGHTVRQYKFIHYELEQKKSLTVLQVITTKTLLKLRSIKGASQLRKKLIKLSNNLKYKNISIYKIYR